MEGEDVGNSDGLANCSTRDGASFSAEPLKGNRNQ